MVIDLINIVVLLNGSCPDLSAYSSDCDKAEFLVGYIYQILLGGA